jgi:prepilin-type N-terminal cleavage/methylation domain-containing protein
MAKKAFHGSKLSSKGFTLVELMIILGILAVLMGIGYPSFQRYYTNGHLRSAARAIVGDFADQKQRAMTGDLAVRGVRVHRMALNLGANQYTLQRCTTTANPCLAWENIQVISLNQYGNDIVFDPTRTNPPNIDFQTRGTVSQAMIVLTNGRGSRATIESNISGRTYVAFNMQ